MKIDIIALMVVAVGFVAALTGCNWLLTSYAPGLSLAAVFMDADIVAKLVLLLLMLLNLPILVIGLVGVLVRSAARPMALILRIAALAAAVLGLLGAAYVWMNVQSGVARVGGSVSIEVTGPGYAEALLVLAYGLAVAGFALIFAVGAGLRAGPRGKA